MISRREFLKIGLVGGGVILLPLKTNLTAAERSQLEEKLAARVASVLDPTTIPKYTEALVIPPAMPSTDELDGIIHYEIGIRQFQQQILPSSMPQTTVWGYGSINHPETFNSPAFTIEGRSNEMVRVTWINQLVDDPNSDAPQFLPHLLPVDQTLHWANPPGPPDHAGGTDPTLYTGPVPIATHVHGAHVPHFSDGHPESWWLPDAANIADGYAVHGTTFASLGEPKPGEAVFEYTNDQPATSLWYHDHALGMTRLNVYAGLAGFWLLRDKVDDGLNLPGPAPKVGDEPETKYYEIPIAIQDRIFNEDGSLFYPDNRAFFDEYEGPFKPETPVSPIWNPEFFGNTMMVNGRTWPYLEVEPRLYRFRLLNGCNSRFLILKFDQTLNFHQIGSDGGLLSGSVAELDQLLMAPAERADVLVDFSTFSPGDEIIMLNLGPDSPFGGLPLLPGEGADPETTGQVMMFRVVEGTGQGQAGEIPASLPTVSRLAADLPSRNVTLNEELYDPADIPVGALLGTNAEGPLRWMDETTEVVGLNNTEIWNIINLTVDAHPIHLHLVQFQILDRTPIRELQLHEAIEAYVRDGQQGDPPDPMNYVAGDPQPPHAWETGWKDTVIAYPGEMTRIVANFDLPGLYVWHCHILEHEDNEMMRNLVVQPADT